MDKTPVMDIDQAERMAARLQAVHRDNQTPCRLGKDTVMVKPLSGNAFRIMGLPVSEPMGLESYKMLEDLGAEPHVEREADYRFYYVATVTWDTMVHYLIRTGILAIRK